MSHVTQNISKSKSKSNSHFNPFKNAISIPTPQTERSRGTWRQQSMKMMRPAVVVQRLQVHQALTQKANLMVCLPVIQSDGRLNSCRSAFQGIEHFRSIADTLCLRIHGHRRSHRRVCAWCARCTRHCEISKRFCPCVDLRKLSLLMLIPL